MDESQSTPKSKRPCFIATPEGMRWQPKTSTPAKKYVSKELNFNAMSLGGPEENVLISNLPRPFFPLNFLKGLEKYLVKQQILPANDGKAINKHLGYNKETNTIIIECKTREIAKQIIAQSKMKFLNQTVKFSVPPQEYADNISMIAGNSNVQIYMEDTVTEFPLEQEFGGSLDNSCHLLENSLDETASQPNFEEVPPEGSSNSVTITNIPQYVEELPPEESNKTVKITNIPQDVEEDILVPFILAALEDTCGVRNTDTIVKTCSSSDAPTSVMIEFVSHDLANKACVLDGIDFLGSPLKISKLNSSAADTITVLNVPSGKETLCHKYIEASLRRNGMFPYGEPIILSFVRQGEDVSMKLRDVAAAKEVLKKESLQFLSFKLIFKERHRTLPSGDIQETEPQASGPKEKDRTLPSDDIFQTELQANGKTATEKRCRSPVTKDTPVIQLKPASFLIKEDAGKVLFIRKLILTRRLFHNRQNFQSAYARLMAEIRSAGVDVDMNDVRQRRSYWQDVNNNVKRGKSTSVYEAPLRVIFDGDPIDDLRGTEFEIEEQNDVKLVDPMTVAATAAVFSKGATFSIEAAKYLIHIVKTNKHLLKYSKNTDHFWREVSSIMALQHFYYDAGSCERKFQSAQKLYRDQSRMLQRTGQEAPREDKSLWFWSQEMHELMANDDISKPLMTISAGSSQRVVTEERYRYSVPPKQEERGSIPRSRIPQLKRPKSKHEARTEAFVMLAEAMNRRTDVMASSQSKKTSVSVTFNDGDEENERSWEHYN